MSSDLQHFYSICMLGCHSVNASVLTSCTGSCDHMAVPVAIGLTSAILIYYTLCFWDVRCYLTDLTSMGAPIHIDLC